MRQYNVTGMSCAACSARVEKAVGKVPGVTSCSVSLLTNSMGVEGDVPPEQIIAAVEAGRIRRLRKRSRRKKTVRSRCNCTGRQRDTGFKTQTDRIRRIFTGIDVFFHGTYDVGMAAAGVV